MSGDPGARRYRVQDGDPYFRAGRLPDGTQALAGVQSDGLVRVAFDTDGRYLRADVRRLPPGCDAGQAEAALRAWLDESGLLPGTISVWQFSVPGRAIGIEELPEHYREALESPDAFDAERGEQLREDVRRWRLRGDFVLHWDEEYYLSRDGEVDST